MPQLGMCIGSHPAGAHIFDLDDLSWKDHVYLQLEPNSTILGSDNLADYGNDVGLNPFYPETIDPCLIYAKNAVDIGIQGKGKIVGHTKNTFTPPPAGDARAAKERPMLIRFDACSQISVSDVSLYRCGAWCMHLKNSSEISLRNVRIQNDKQDGFDLDSCQNVSISDCHLDCGDDAIAITTSVKDLVTCEGTSPSPIACSSRAVRASVLGHCLKAISEDNLRLHHCIFYDCILGGIKLGVFEGATIRNCVLRQSGDG